MTIATDPITDPPFRVGDVVCLNGGHTKLLVVDLTPTHVVVAWRCYHLTLEKELPLASVHRVEVT
jgi:hypothetical protein